MMPYGPAGSIRWVLCFESPHKMLYKPRCGPHVGGSQTNHSHICVGPLVVAPTSQMRQTDINNNCYLSHSAHTTPICPPKSQPHAATSVFRPVFHPKIGLYGAFLMVWPQGIRGGIWGFGELIPEPGERYSKFRFGQCTGKG